MDEDGNGDRRRPEARNAEHHVAGKDYEPHEDIDRFYDGQRRHSALGDLSPRGFEQRLHQEALTG